MATKKKGNILLGSEVLSTFQIIRYERNGRVFKDAFNHITYICAQFKFFHSLWALSSKKKKDYPFFKLNLSLMEVL